MYKCLDEDVYFEHSEVVEEDGQEYEVCPYCGTVDIISYHED